MRGPLELVGRRLEPCSANIFLFIAARVETEVRSLTVYVARFAMASTVSCWQMTFVKWNPALAEESYFLCHFYGRLRSSF